MGGAMTKKQQKEIIKVIKADATVQYSYYNPKTGEMCVIGGLATAAGVPITVLKACKNEDITEWNGSCARVRTAIHAKFGLLDREMRLLQMVNDGYASTRERRAALIKCVNDELEVD
jgi:hypothetical protein